MFIASSSDVAGALPGLQSVATAMRARCLRKGRDRRRGRFADTVIGAGQHHRDGGGARNRLGARLVGVFEVVGRKRTKARGEAGGAQVRELVGVQLHRQAMPPRRFEDARHLLRRKADTVAEGIDGVGEPLRRDRRQPFLDDEVDVAVLVTPRFRRQRMRRQIAGRHSDPALATQAACHTKLPRFRVAVEAVARLHLDRRDALGDQRVQPRQRLAEQRCLIGLPGRRDGGEDAAALPGDLFVGRTLDPQLELARAVAGVHDMGVAIDQPGSDPAARAIRHLRRAATLGGQLRLRPGIDDAPIPAGDGARRVGRLRPVRAHRQQAGIAEQAIGGARLCYLRPPLPVLACIDITQGSAKRGRDGMAGLHFRSALLAEGWRQDVRLDIEAGRIAAIGVGEPARPGDERHGIAIPGLPNLHSHAFQRAMAGLTEIRGHATDDFWSWRETMYRFALSMTPDDVEAVASQLYVEMLEAGFTAAGEFHYLHHDIDGRPYGAVAEMADRLVAAAARSGIGLTLLPVFYAHANFGGAPPRPEQRRFVSDLEGFARLLEQTRTAAARLPGTVVGVAPHSLRAVTPAELQALTELAGDGPTHIHVAEQRREVEDCIAWSGAPPVRWLLDHAAIDARWCLVHATHMAPDETERFARSGAVAGLCPITEADLGDGTFDAMRFLAAGGRFGVGSDSNVMIDAAAELRQLEYSQRLQARARNVLGAPGGSTGGALFGAALRGGAQALGISAGLHHGAPADIVALDDGHPRHPYLAGDDALDTWIFAAGRTLVDTVWVGGRKRVEGGRHHASDAVARSYRATMQRLLSLPR